jgi:hypothetical protein
MVKLVAIGDSLTQGFQSLAICRTQFSYPAMIAECMGCPVPEFQTPDFMGSGGLPFNIEWLARKLQDKYGRDISFFEWPAAIDSIRRLLDDVEDYWERGPGNKPVKDTRYHNLAVWGFEVADAYDITPEICRERIALPKDEWFRPPSEPRLRTAARTLNPGRLPQRDRDTQVEIARQIARDGDGIENLIVWLGANNCLGTVVQLEIVETGDDPPGHNSPFSLWRPMAFRQEYQKLSEKIQRIGAQNVYVGTVPHVTVPPITRGVMKNKGRLPATRKYFDFYTRFFIQDKHFTPDRDPHLTGLEAQKIDEYIDQYNVIIREKAHRHGWHLVDTCAVLDNLAVRRNHGKPKYPLPTALKDLNIRFFEIENNGKLKNGGLIALDGVHPTTCGYAIVADEFIQVMKKQNPDIKDIDFDEIRKWDSLVANPPITLNDVFGMLQTLEKYFHISKFLGK